MSTRDDNLRARIRGWVAKAEDDFESASILLAHAPPVHGSIGFLSQQCAEKYLKAFLVARGVDPPRTHSISALLDQIARMNPAIAESLERADGLSDYGVAIRYPFQVPDLSLDLAREAVALATKVREALGEALGEVLDSEGD